MNGGISAHTKTLSLNMRPTPIVGHCGTDMSNKPLYKIMCNNVLIAGEFTDILVSSLFSMYGVPGL
jgi:hypothetical protein